jgi:hypothetical protein
MRLKKKIRICSLILIAFGATLNSCTNEKQVRLNIICLIDYSGSLPNDVLLRYAKTISHDVYGNLKSRDKITVIPIDEGAKTDATKIFVDDLSSHKEFSKQSDGLAHKQDSIKNRVTKYIHPKIDSLFNIVIQQKEIRKKFTRETDIVSAIEQASLNLEKNSDVSKYNTTNVFILFSDMLHESNEFNLRTLNATNNKQLDNILTKLNSENHIPDLKSCIVFANGRTGVNNKVVETTQYFWEQFFKNANAELKAYDFDCSNSIIQYIQSR